MPVNYHSRYIASGVLSILAVMIAVIVKTAPADLGLNPIILNWLVVVQAGIAAALAFLPSLTRPPEAAAKDAAARQAVGMAPHHPQDAP